MASQSNSPPSAQAERHPSDTRTTSRDQTPHSHKMLQAAQIASIASTALAVGAALGFYYGQRQQRSAAANDAKRKRCGFPKRLILVRHGESEGNIDPLLYCRVPDNAMHLTELGYEQAVAAGKSIKKIIGDDSVVRRRLFSFVFFFFLLLVCGCVCCLVCAFSDVIVHVRMWICYR